MSKQSKHERIIREELELVRNQLTEAETAMRSYKDVVDVFVKNVDTLERLLAKADADKGGDDA